MNHRVHRGHRVRLKNFKNSFCFNSVYSVNSVVKGVFL